jgi:hypothetical protein
MFYSKFSLGRLLKVLLILLSLGIPSTTNQAQGESPYQLAQRKSQRMARIGIQWLAGPKSRYSSAPVGMRHVFPFRRPAGVRYEGVGYSAFSPQDAIRNACHYGRRPILTSAVVRGRDGYYATVFYR